MARPAEADRAIRLTMRLRLDFIPLRSQIPGGLGGSVKLVD